MRNGNDIQRMGAGRPGATVSGERRFPEDNAVAFFDRDDRDGRYGGDGPGDHDDRGDRDGGDVARGVVRRVGRRDDHRSGVLLRLGAVGGLLALVLLLALLPFRAPAASPGADPAVSGPAASVPVASDPIPVLDAPTDHPVLADSPAPAPFALRLPLRCEPPGCFIQNYFDQDPGAGVRDYACGFLSYDGHTGTDFRVSLAAMRTGVPVYAAAAGVVLATRDGEVDESLRVKGAEAVAGREAGNAVVVDHGDGWVTQYNHLKRGSVAVRRGDRVQAGSLLGMVGLSGRTEFPHLELEVRKDGRPVGPFVGLETATSCGPGPHPLWTPAALAALPYTGGGPVACGFSRAPPDLHGLYDWGEAAGALPADAPALVFWAAVYGVRVGDRLVLTITDPRGGVFQQRTTELRRTQAQFSAFVGRRRGTGLWPEGTYVGRCLLLRGQVVVADMTADLAVRARE